MENSLEKIPLEYKVDIEKAIKILKEEGCQEVFLFGSLAEGRQTINSDIDLAVKGCPNGKFFHVLGKLLVELNHSVDLINLDKKDDFVQFLEREGTLLYVQ